MSDDPPPLVLNPINVDYYGIYDSLESDLKARGTWNALLKSSTGSALLRWIASVGAFGQGGIARALQENFPSTARSPSAVYRAALLQGIHVIRTRPGSVAVRLQRTDALATTLAVPAFTQWSVDGVPYYNRAPVVMPSTGDPVDTFLTQGEIGYDSFESTGLPNQRFVLGDPNTWTLGDLDVWAIDSQGRTWTSIRTGLWRETNQSLKFFESTMPDGRIECRFGDGAYGSIPPVGVITFGAAICLSAADADAAAPAEGATVSVTGYAISGVTTAAASASQDPPSPEFYKAMGTGGAANNQRAVTRDDYRAVALEYPGVVDAVFRGQAEVNPSDLRSMNVVYATLLTASTWTEAQWLEFKRFMESQRGIASTVLARIDPVPVTLDLNITLRVFPEADIGAVTELARSAVANLLRPSNRSLGRSLYHSDVSTAVLESATYQQAPNETGLLIDFVEIPSFLEPIKLPPTSYFVPGNIVIDCQYTTRGLSAAATGEILGL
jgi:hypothetical protein